jgi:hypothetical protein
LLTDADLSGVTRYTHVADINIVALGSQIYARLLTNGDVARTGGVAIEGIKTVGRVVAAGGVAIEGITFTQRACESRDRSRY